MNKLLKGDDLVAVRDAIVCDIDKACGVFKDDVLDRKELTRILNKVANTKGFTVELGYEADFWAFGYQRTGKCIRIKDHEGFECIIYKLEEKGIYRTHYSPYYLQTEKELEAEAQWEQDADNAYEKYLDYKASFDDPRGY